MPESQDRDRLAQLRSHKLRSLIRRLLATDTQLTTVSIPGGAALLESGTRRAWALIEEPDPRLLGPALLWAEKAGALEAGGLSVLVTDPATAGLVSRRAQAFAEPPAVLDPELRAVAPAPAPEILLPSEEAMALAPQLAAAGAEPVVSDGRLSGQVLGLEVARVVQDRDGAWVIEAGVGRHDREATAELFPGRSTEEKLLRVVQAVKERRRSGQPSHPANQLSQESWLLEVLMAHPQLVGGASLARVPAALPVEDLRQRNAAIAEGESSQGHPLVVAASVGLDPDLVPAAGDARQAHIPDAELRLAVPEGRDIPTQRALAARLKGPVEWVTVPSSWQSLLA